MDREIQQRLQWVKMYEECGDAGLVCRHCGISRPTLRKWAKRYKQCGVAGLKNGHDSNLLINGSTLVQ